MDPSGCTLSVTFHMPRAGNYVTVYGAVEECSFSEASRGGLSGTEPSLRLNVGLPFMP